MDPVTHIAVGAVIGEAVLGRKEGGLAMLVGALAGALPDIDIIPSLFMGPIGKIECHRGLTHSIIFAVLAALAGGLLIGRLAGRGWGKNRFAGWALLLLLALFSHCILDCMTAYGTRIFLPFSDYPVALGNISFIDPLVALPLIFPILYILATGGRGAYKKAVLVSGICLSSLYLMLTGINKVYVNSLFEQSLIRQNYTHSRLFTTPALLTNLLWTGIAEGRDAYYAGYYSIFDRGREIVFETIQKNHTTLGKYSDDDSIKKLVVFSRKFYTVRNVGGSLYFNDLRYGGVPDGNGSNGSVISYLIRDKNGRAEVERQHIIMDHEYLLALMRRMLRHR
ncbi:MAG: metal-dependent hydrolase [Spirochaetes bacterium]|nr:metal-dependent hydrolase [Spirochaetota bacterium]